MTEQILARPAGAGEDLLWTSVAPSQSFSLRNFQLLGPFVLNQVT